MHSCVLTPFSWIFYIFHCRLFTQHSMPELPSTSDDSPCWCPSGPPGDSPSLEPLEAQQLSLDTSDAAPGYTRLQGFACPGGDKAISQVQPGWNAMRQPCVDRV